MVKGILWDLPRDVQDKGQARAGSGVGGAQWDVADGT